MSDLFLIAHKVRGEPAFDVASQMPCPICGVGGPEPTCSECDGTGYWWIVPTSGHRAYPWWHLPLKIEDIDNGMRLIMDHNPQALTWTIFAMPSALPDHYTSRAASPVPTGLAALLAKRKPMNVERRGR